VTFWNGPVGTGTNLGSGTVNSSGVATITTSALPLGTLTINAVYSNGVNTNYLPSAPQSLTQIVRRATTMAFSPFVAPNNSFGAPLNYQVSVTPTTAAGTPTGTLTISEIVGSVTTPLASSGYAGGTISILVPTLSVGTHTLVLDYSGDATFAPNSKTITQTIVTTATTTTLDPVSPAFYGETVTFTATVTSPPAVDPTIGTVTFRDTYNGVTTTLATVTLSGTNVAQFTTTETQLKAGSHSIVAIYNNVGNPDYASSAPSAARIQVINKATTQTVLDPLSDSSFGNAVTFHATVSVTSPGSPGVLPGGTVTFRSTTIININSIPTPVTVVLGSATVNASGIATLTVSGTALAVTPPDHTITATYNGFAPNFAASAASAGLTQTINKADVNIGVTTSAASGTLTFGKAVTFTAVLSNASGGSPGAPLGTVQFWDGPVGSGTLLKSVTLVAINANSSKAVFVTTATQLSASSHDINVAYLGDAKHAATTQSLTYDMNQATTVTKLTSSPQFWPLNGVTTFIATVSANSGGTPGFPKGTVVFTIDGVPQAPVTLVNGKATKTFTFTTSTDHTVSADYLPVQNFADSSAAPQTQLVRKASTIGFTSVSTVTGVNVTATVTSGATGTVSFYENGVFLGSATIVNGVAKTSLVIGTGTHNITAVYSGDANFNPASITKAISGKLIGRLV
jgi:hypothetical protein